MHPCPAASKGPPRTQSSAWPAGAGRRAASLEAARGSLAKRERVSSRALSRVLASVMQTKRRTLASDEQQASGGPPSDAAPLLLSRNAATTRGLLLPLLPLGSESGPRQPPDRPDPRSFWTPPHDPDGSDTWVPRLSAFTVISTEQIPRRVFELMVPGLRWHLRGNAYAYFMPERYPPLVGGQRRALAPLVVRCGRPARGYRRSVLRCGNRSSSTRRPRQRRVA
jgi:hypothetical protein